MASKRRHQGMWLRSFAGALFLHGLCLAFFFLLLAVQEPASRRGKRRAGVLPRLEGPAVAVRVVPEFAPQLLPLTLVPLEAISGAGDETGTGQEHPLPAREHALPGTEAARSAPRGEGGAPVSSARRDREELRAQVWNDPRDNQPFRRRRAHEIRSPESIARAPESAASDRSTRRELASAGAPGHGQRGRESDAERELTPSDPGDPLLHTEAVGGHRRGRPHPDRRVALLERGRTANEGRHGDRAADVINSVARSNELDPGLLDLSRPGGGGAPDESGIAGTGGDGDAADGTRDARGTAAVTARVRRGPGRATVLARRQIPYFRRLYEQLDARVEYPHRLALGLEQGTVVVTFTLFADGRVTGVRVAKTSGFVEFDAALTTAVQQIGSFGPVPPALLAGSGAIVVRAPYEFRNPMIR